MALDALLLELLVCPEDKGPLWYLADEAVLYNPRLHRAYPVREGIPVLLVDEAATLSEEEAVHFAAIAETRGVRTGPASAGESPAPTQ